MDYHEWATEVPGIIGAWPYKSQFPGQIDVYVEADATSSGSADGIPTASQLAAVKASIEFDSGGFAQRRPVGAEAITVRPIVRTAFDVDVHGVSGVPDLVETQAEITAAIGEYLRTREPFVEGLTVPPRTDRVSAASVGGIVDDIVGAAGGLFSAVTVRRSGARVDIYSLAIGERAKPGMVTFS